MWLLGIMLFGQSDRLSTLFMVIVIHNHPEVDRTSFFNDTPFLWGLLYGDICHLARLCFGQDMQEIAEIGKLGPFQPWVSVKNENNEFCLSDPAWLKRLSPSFTNKSNAFWSKFCQFWIKFNSDLQMDESFACECVRFFLCFFHLHRFCCLLPPVYQWFLVVSPFFWGASC